MLKAVGLADQNLLHLMATDDFALVNAEAREYVQLRRVQVLQKLKLQMATEEATEAELQLEANMTRERAVGVQGSGDCGEPPPEADQLVEDTQERSPEEPIRLSTTKLLQTNCSRTSTEFAADLL